MKVSFERYLSINDILIRLTSNLQSLTQYSIELRAAAFEGSFYPCILEWFEDVLKDVLELRTQLKNSLSEDNLLNDLKKEIDNEE